MQAAYPSLADFDYHPYIDAEGQLPHQFEGQIGVYAIYAEDKTVAYIGYSRDVSLSLRQHLVRQPQSCFWVKVCTVEKPDRTLLENIKAFWIDENGSVPLGNSELKFGWEQPIDVKSQMLPEESAQYTDPQLDEQKHQSVLKNAARRIEKGILEALSRRGVQEQLRFNPKLKDNGLLDLK
jgi:hypothetical protein